MPAEEPVEGLPLRFQRPPLCPELELLLIEPDLDLDATLANTLASEAPFWAFAWASGQVLARWLLDHPDQVRAKRVVDLGCGSGLVAIAAGQAGAARVSACDCDPDARAAASANAERNRVELAVTQDLESALGVCDLLVASDVLYEPAAARSFWSAAAMVPAALVADPERQPFAPEIAARLDRLERMDAVTWPELGEDVRSASVYRVLATAGSPSSEA